MASLLVRTTRGVIDTIRARAEDTQAELLPGELPQPALSYLDPESIAFVVWLEHGTLRCGMTIHQPIVERGRLVGGCVILHDRDLTPFLHRLGCLDPADAATWSEDPRVLPPNDVDLLRYELGLPFELVLRRNLILPPTTLAPEDELDRSILAEVWANPDSDTARMIYADRLQQRADPRGELIAVQLARGRHGRVTDHERQLLARHAHACARPLAPFLDGFELERGFLTRAIVDERQPIPSSLLEHPLWSLVEELHTSHASVLRLAPLLALRVLRTSGGAFTYVSSLARTLLRVEAVVGVAPAPGQAYRGLALPDLAAWQRIGVTTVWPALRALSVDTGSSGGSLIPAAILETDLGKRLAHLDLTFDRREPLIPHQLFGALARSKTIQRVSLLAGFESRFVEPLAMIYDRRPDDSYALTVQLPPYGPAAATAALPFIAAFGRGIHRITVTYVPIHGHHHDPAADRILVDGLRGAFDQVTVVDELRTPICPWAYPVYSAGVPSGLRL